jgi:hypothetical protein
VKQVFHCPFAGFERLVQAPLLLALIWAATLQAQTSQAQTPSKNSSSATGSVDFAIETEMLTYRAVESNSEAIACDIAGFLNGAPANFSGANASAPCDVKLSGRKATVVLLPYDNNQLANFQIWRSDMATMDRLQRKEAKDCPAGKTGTTPATTTASSMLSTVMGLSPASGPLAIAQSALAVMAHDESVSTVAGTVHDEAFQSGVARQLRALGVTVVMPSVFSPFSLTPLDAGGSPFLASLERTLAAQESCYEFLATIPDPAGGKDSNAVKQSEPARRANEMILAINSYLDLLTQSASGSNGQAAPGSGGGSASGAKAAAATATTQSAPTFSGGHLQAVLSADGLAQKLGVEASTGALPEGIVQHILLVKALESGGAIDHHSNIFGARVSYSGGSVGTYSLFTMSGDLECSGNAFDYFGALPSKQFTSELNKYKVDPSRQVMFLHGGCRAGLR